jgi:hypothetical protein
MAVFVLSKEFGARSKEENARLQEIGYLAEGAFFIDCNLSSNLCIS